MRWSVIRTNQDGFDHNLFWSGPSGSTFYSNFIISRKYVWITTSKECFFIHIMSHGLRESRKMSRIRKTESVMRIKGLRHRELPSRRSESFLFTSMHELQGKICFVQQCFQPKQVPSKLSSEKGKIIIWSMEASFTQFWSATDDFSNFSWYQAPI